ncbi:MAG: T9SS type A sorting domain-containing protein [Saprospiraceae bacterium]|nr:T9SS type A sorting domain-containing protein [Saprospiraceae bacterium]
MMKNLWFIAALAMLTSSAFAQQENAFSIYLQEEPFPEFPAMHSFVEGHHAGKWVFIGGRTDGLHQRQPFAAFDPDFNNLSIYVADFATHQVWSKPLNDLPTDLLEQLQSSNMEFVQRGDVLYITGGYGYSLAVGEWVTYPYLTAVDLPGLVSAVVGGQPVGPYFRQLTDERMRVTGGYLGLQNDEFYLVGGQVFQGRYNPHGPDHGPGFYQKYTNAIKQFTIEDDGTTLAIGNYIETIDSLNLHRRDYNMAPQIFPNGSQGFTVFSGVFQYDQDLPWLNTVDVFPNSYQVNNDFNQYLNQYHTAHAGLFSASQNEMHTLFFGGISRYYLDANGVLKEDPEVPFVNTISLVTRKADGSMLESKLGEMPALLGASASFLPADGLATLSNGILDLDAAPDQDAFIGYVVGGIESTLPNILFIDDGTLSDASGRVFKVFLTKQATNVVEIKGQQYFGLKVFPNPAADKLTVNFSVPVDDEVQLIFKDSTGKALLQEKRKVSPGDYELTYEIAQWPVGVYFLEVRNNRFEVSSSFIKK